jgi:hypothetical protein
VTFSGRRSYKGELITFWSKKGYLINKVIYEEILKDELKVT